MYGYSLVLSFLGLEIRKVAGKGPSLESKSPRGDLHRVDERLARVELVLGRRAREVDVRCDARRHGPAHRDRQERHADLERGAVTREFARSAPGGSEGTRAGRGKRERHVLGPSETLPSDKLEVDTLVSVLGVDHMRQLDRVKLLGHDSIDCKRTKENGQTFVRSEEIEKDRGGRRTDSRQTQRSSCRSTCTRAGWPPR